METRFVADDRDPLTGLIGSGAAQKTIDGWQKQAAQSGQVPAIHAMLLGLRRLDAINLAFGQQVGDQALVQVAARIERFMRREMDGEWVIARAGGGSFLIAVFEMMQRERWHRLAEQLAQIVAQPFELESATVRLWPRLSLMRGGPSDNARCMVGQLAETLERAPLQQGRRVLWAERKMNPGGYRPDQLESDLLNARDRGEIGILFQPQYCAATGQIVGAEALARWEHPTLGQLGAATLFAIADGADQIGHLSLHIMREALTAATRWPDHLRLSLNVTASDLAASNFSDQIAAKLAETGFPAERLTIEITEEVLLSELECSAKRLRQLSDLGVRIALDDFGAGFCNFRYLKSLPLNYLKLDRTMVEGIADDQRDLVVFRGILAMASALGLSVIAEGIESEQQLQITAREGCDAWQGFLGAQPLSATEFGRLVVA